MSHQTDIRHKFYRNSTTEGSKYIDGHCEIVKRLTLYSILLSKTAWCLTFNNINKYPPNKSQNRSRKDAFLVCHQSTQAADRRWLAAVAYSKAQASHSSSDWSFSVRDAPRNKGLWYSRSHCEAIMPKIRRPIMLYHWYEEGTLWPCAHPFSERYILAALINAFWRNEVGHALKEIGVDHVSYILGRRKDKNVLNVTPNPLKFKRANQKQIKAAMPANNAFLSQHNQKKKQIKPRGRTTRPLLLFVFAFKRKAKAKDPEVRRRKTRRVATWRAGILTNFDRCRSKQDFSKESHTRLRSAL